MHRLKRPSEPRQFFAYRQAHADSRNWEAFRDSSAYLEAKETLVENQYGLCAYCESQLPPKISDVRLEHFHKKSDPDPSHNWMLDWRNLMVVCLSAADARRSCDVGKDDVQMGNVKVRGLPKGYDLEGYVLNPYDMPNVCLFCFDPPTGRLAPDASACSRVTVPENRFSTVIELVDTTIAVFNLNCDQLCNIRKAIHREYEKLRKEYRHVATNSVRERIAEEWFGHGRVMSMYTTRRALLGKFAEKVLGS